jgi:hypothetical protein
MVPLQAKTNMFKIAHIKKQMICSSFGTIDIPQCCCFRCYNNSILQHEGDCMPQALLLDTLAKFRIRRYARMVMFLLGAATVSFTPAAAENSQKVFEVPASKVRAMTPDQREQAKAYARQHGIRWRIVEGK